MKQISFDRKAFKEFWNQISPIGKIQMTETLGYNAVYLSQIANDKKDKYNPSKRLINSISDYMAKIRSGESA